MRACEEGHAGGLSRAAAFKHRVRILVIAFGWILTNYLMIPHIILCTQYMVPLKQKGEILPEDVSGSGRAANVVSWEGGAREVLAQ